jgi:hypothetical protein
VGAGYKPAPLNSQSPQARLAWRHRLLQLEGSFISRVASGVAACFGVWRHADQ